MKRILTFVLALSMALSLAACGGKADDNKKNDNNTEVTMTAQEIMDTLKEKLGDSFDCDVTEDETRMSGYWGLGYDAGRKLGIYEQFQFRHKFQRRRHCQGQGWLRPGCRRAFADRL